MKLLVVAATALAGVALVAAPVTYLRGRHPPPAMPASLEPLAAGPEPTLETPVTLPSIRITDELVRAREIRSPAPPGPANAPALRPRPAPRPRLQRGSMLARLFFGAGDHRPQPFPRPRS